MQLKLRDGCTIDTDALIGHLDRSMFPTAHEAAAVIRDLLPKPGTGACICKFSPKTSKEFAARTNTGFEHWQGSMTLDHRCTHHGEKAQPALWGRHKTLELVVTPREWLSLGVERPE